jgi:plastocyanin
VWENRDDAPHTATAAGDRPFDTKVLRKGQRSRPISFDAPGEYGYICDLHPFMKGTVVVR